MQRSTCLHPATIRWVGFFRSNLTARAIALLGRADIDNQRDEALAVSTGASRSTVGQRVGMNSMGDVKVGR